MKASKYIALALGATLLAGCNSMDSGPREGAGTVVGAVAGGVIGSQFGSGGGKVAATVAGAVVGGLIGGAIGRDLDEQDREMAYEAEMAALENGPSGRRREWRNPDSGHYGYVTPGRPYRDDGYDCREYTHTIYVEGRPRTASGTACRQPDGTWRPMDA